MLRNLLRDEKRKVIWCIKAFCGYTLECLAVIRNIEKALGHGMKKPTSSELKNRDIVRKSIVAVKNIKKGDILSTDNIGVKRPGTGINPMQWDEVLNKTADRDFKIDDQIVFDK